MLAFERLVEAVGYANEEGTLWWQQFSTKLEAKTVLQDAQRDRPDEYQVIELADRVGEYYPYDDWGVDEMLSSCVRVLKRQLRKKS